MAFTDCISCSLLLMGDSSRGTLLLPGPHLSTIKCLNHRFQESQVGIKLICHLKARRLPLWLYCRLPVSSLQFLLHQHLYEFNMVKLFHFICHIIFSLATILWTFSFYRYFEELLEILVWNVQEPSVQHYSSEAVQRIQTDWIEHTSAAGRKYVILMDFF